jgi:hypothetical protein
MRSQVTHSFEMMRIRFGIVVGAADAAMLHVDQSKPLRLADGVLVNVLGSDGRGDTYGQPTACFLRLLSL